MDDRPRPSCPATTASGEPCRARPLPDDARCFAHSDRLAEARTEARRRGGANSSTVARLSASLPPVLADTLTTLTAALDDTAAGRMPASRGQAVASLGRAIASVYSEHAVEQRLDDLEQRLTAATVGGRPNLWRVQ